MAESIERKMKVAELVNAFMIEVEPPVANCADLSFDAKIALHCFKMNNGASQAFTFRKEGFAVFDDDSADGMRETFLSFAESQVPKMGVTDFDNELYLVPGIATEESIVVRSLFQLVGDS